jgi:hypothetical protein
VKWQLEILTEHAPRVTPEDFHQEWAAAFDRLLQDAAEATNAKWPNINSTYSNEAFNLDSLKPILLTARCLASHFKAAIVQHHWQTRFYQQLSPAIALVEMACLYYRNLPPSDKEDDCESQRFWERFQKYWRPKMTRQQSQWLEGCQEANWFVMCNQAMLGIANACEWAKLHPRPVSESKQADFDKEGNLHPGDYDFAKGPNQYFSSCSDWLQYLMIAACLPTATLRTILPDNLQYQRRCQRSSKLHQVSKWLSYFAFYPNREDVQAAHDHIKLVTRICAAARATCKCMAAQLDATWTTLGRLYITPDTPDGHKKSEGVSHNRYSRADAWVVLQNQLLVMSRGVSHFEISKRTK